MLIGTRYFSSITAGTLLTIFESITVKIENTCK
jgi:hypothetical protein